MGEEKKKREEESTKGRGGLEEAVMKELTHRVHL